MNKLIKHLPILSFILLSLFTSAQQNTIKGEVYSLSNEEAILGRYYQDQYIFLDTAKVTAGSFEFTLEENSPVGMYFIRVDNWTSIDVVYNKENIDFSTELRHYQDDFIEKSSPTNKRYYQKIHEEQQLQKEKQNQRILSVKMGSTDFEKNLAKRLYEESKVNINAFYEDLKKTKATYFTDAFVLAQAQPLTDDKLTVQEQQTTLKTSYFDYLDANDTILLYSNVLTRKVYNYIMLFRDRSLTPSAQDSSYKKCIDGLMAISKKPTKTSDFIQLYAVDNFTKMAIVDILPYINQAYLDQYKKESIVTETIKNELLRIESLKPGNVAPNFSHVDLVGNNFELHKYKSEYTLVMFWASWCGHCRHALPNVKILYDDQPSKKVQVVAIALDSKEEEWRQFLIDGGYNWINITDLKGWDGPIVKDYMVHSTPTFYLLDKDKKIIQKAKNIAELEPYFK